MTPKGNAFSPKQETFIAAYLQTGNVTQSAKIARVGKKAVYRWYKAGLKEEIARRQKELADNAMKKMQMATDGAIDYLVSVLNNSQSPPADKLRAAETIIKNGLKAWESERLGLLADLEIKLEELSNEN